MRLLTCAILSLTFFAMVETSAIAQDSGAIITLVSDPNALSNDDQSNQTLADWPRKEIGGIQIAPKLGDVPSPSDQSQRLLGRYSNQWSNQPFTYKPLHWESPAITHRPLLFEDVAHERYGHVAGNEHFQTFVSAVHFASGIALLPLHAYHDRWDSQDSPLGYARPGNYTEKIFQRQFWGRRR